MFPCQYLPSCRMHTVTAVALQTQLQRLCSVDSDRRAVIPPLKTCQATKHRFDEGSCRVCTVCGLCTGYGPSCRRHSSQDRMPGM